MSWGESTNAGWGLETAAPSSPRRDPPANNNGWGGSTTTHGGWGEQTAAPPRSAPPPSWGGQTTVQATYTYDPAPPPAASAPRPSGQPSLISTHSMSGTNGQPLPAYPVGGQTVTGWGGGTTTAGPPSSPSPQSGVIWGLVRTNITKISTNTRTFEDYEGKLGTRMDNQEMRKRMQDIRAETLRLINEARQQLQSQPDRTLAEDLRRAVDAFQSVAQRCESREKDVLRVMRASVSAGTGGPPPPEVQRMQQTYDMDYDRMDDELIEEYNNDIRGLVDDMRALQDVQAQVNTMVAQQQTGIDQMETNVTVARSNVDQGTADIEEARDLACSVRYKKLIIGGIIAGALIIIIIIIVVSVVVSQDNA